MPALNRNEVSTNIGDAPNDTQLDDGGVNVGVDSLKRLLPTPCGHSQRVTTVDPAEFDPRCMLPHQRFRIDSQDDMRPITVCAEHALQAFFRKPEETSAIQQSIPVLRRQAIVQAFCQGTRRHRFLIAQRHALQSLTDGHGLPPLSTFQVEAAIAVDAMEIEQS